MKLILRLFFFSALAVILGLGSARYMVEHGASFTTQQVGPWRFWQNEGRLDADPYTRARAARSGRLELSSASALFLTAVTDNDGRRLTSDCSYEIIARPIPSQWWNITVYDSGGALIPNKAGRHSFSSENLTLPTSGAHHIYLSSKARGGAWLPSGDSNRLTLVMNIIRPQNLADASTGRLQRENLPEIRKTGCS